MRTGDSSTKASILTSQVVNAAPTLGTTQRIPKYAHPNATAAPKASTTPGGSDLPDTFHTDRPLSTVGTRQCNWTRSVIHQRPFALLHLHVVCVVVASPPGPPLTGIAGIGGGGG